VELEAQEVEKGRTQAPPIGKRPPITFRYLSLGAGVQSTAVLAMSVLGLKGCPKADCAIFADTGDEPDWTYAHLALLEKWAAERGFPIHRCTHGKLSDSYLDGAIAGRKRFAAIPAWTAGENGRGAPLRRQCTREYKIDPIERTVRKLLGVPRVDSRKLRVGCLLGISLDEIERVRDSRTPWIENEYPLIAARMTRNDCIALIREVGLPTPRKSSCVMCPYHSDAYWRDLKTNFPEEWEKAVKFDEAIRDASKSGARNPIFLHRSLRPLRSLDFDRQGEMFGDGFGNECHGVCGV
jgi:hypothetical protein